MLALYRLGSYIPVPGVNTDAVEQIENNYAQRRLLGLLNLFSGGGAVADRDLRARDHAVHHGVDHPAAADGRLAGAGEAAEGGRGRPGADHAVHALPDRRPGRARRRSATSFLFRSQGNRAGAPVFDNFTPGSVILIVLCLTAGLRAADVDGRADHPARHRQRHLADDLRLDRVAACPHGVQAWWTNPDQVFKVIMPFLALGVIAAIVFIQEGQRRIPIQYAKRVIGRRMSSGGQTYLPLRVNMAGVIPVIFAASIMAFPPTIGAARPGRSRASRPSSARAAGPTSSARRSSSSSSPTSTPRSRSTRSTRRTT